MKFIYYPLTKWRITQPFGADTVCFKEDDRRESHWKRTEDTCRTGFHSIYKKAGMKGHNGIDIAAPVGTDLLSATNGRVAYVAAQDTGFGTYCEVFGKIYDGEARKVRYYRVRYAHLSALSVKIGDIVKVGDLIGYTGNTGHSTGPHLHFDFKWADKNGRTLNYENGFYGAVDPTQYFTGKTANFIRLWRKFLWR